jgi:hypothetical protein
MKVNRMKLLTRRKVLLSGTIIGGFGLLAGFIYLGLKWTAISVVVTNIGESPIREITVIQKVDGREYSLGNLGNIESGVTRTVWVRPRATGSIDLQFINSQRQKVNLTVDGYVEPGYAGTISVDLIDGRLARCVNQIRVSFY